MRLLLVKLKHTRHLYTGSSLMSGVGAIGTCFGFGEAQAEDP